MEEVDLQQGMPVGNEAGEALGKLSALLVGDEDEDAEFLVLERGGSEHLVPFEAVLGVGDGTLLLDVPASAVEKFPRVQGDADPSDADIEKAYAVYDEHAEYVDEE